MPSAPATAHSTCAHSAEGAECMNSTPRVVTQPTVPGRGAIAAANGELYVLDCGAGLAVLKLEPSRRKHWSR